MTVTWCRRIARLRQKRFVLWSWHREGFRTTHMDICIFFGKAWCAVFQLTAQTCINMNKISQYSLSFCSVLFYLRVYRLQRIKNASLEYKEHRVLYHEKLWLSNVSLQNMINNVRILNVMFGRCWQRCSFDLSFTSVSIVTWGPCYRLRLAKSRLLFDRDYG